MPATHKIDGTKKGATDENSEPANDFGFQPAPWEKIPWKAIGNFCLTWLGWVFFVSAAASTASAFFRIFTDNVFETGLKFFWYFLIGLLYAVWWYLVIKRR